MQQTSLTALERRTAERKLDERRATLLHDIQDESELVTGEGGIGELFSAERDDASVTDALVALNLANFERHVHELRAIESAKRRIREGTYGICERCGHPIQLGRLLADPSVARCFSCQSSIEHTKSIGVPPNEDQQ